VKGILHWLSAARAHSAEVRVYDRLFKVAQPGTDHDFLQDLNLDSMRVVRAQLEPALADAAVGETFQFERHGYFTVDPRGGFNRTVTLRDSWAK
jgi:glutaminyl-tRNA synthetase